METQRGVELFPFGPKWPLDVETWPKKSTRIWDGVASDGGMPRSQSRQRFLFGFTDASGDDYDELGSLETKNQEDDVIYQGEGLI